MPKKHYEMLVIARSQILIKNNQVFVEKINEGIDNILLIGTDHWLIYNKRLRFNVWFPDKEKQLFYEGLHCKIARLIYHTELNNYHFPHIKNSRASGNENAIKNAFTLEQILQSDLVGTRIDPKMLDKERILQIYDSFDWSKATYKKP